MKLDAMKAAGLLPGAIAGAAPGAGEGEGNGGAAPVGGAMLYASKKKKPMGAGNGAKSQAEMEAEAKAAAEEEAAAAKEEEEDDDDEWDADGDDWEVNLDKINIAAKVGFSPKKAHFLDLRPSEDPSITHNSLPRCDSSPMPFP